MSETVTAQEINALPDKIRRYIHDLETRCDPAGEVRERALLKDENEQLRKKVEELLHEAQRDVRAVVASEREGEHIPQGLMETRLR